MRIAYFAHWNQGPESGVFKKLMTQLSSWKAMGVECKLFLLSRTGSRGLDSRPEICTAQYSSIGSRLSALRFLVEQVAQYKPSVIYRRSDLFLPPVLRLPKTAPVITEVNGLDVEEFRGNWLRHMSNLATRGIMLDRSAGLVFVRQELAESPVYRMFDRPNLVLGNSIDLSLHPQLRSTSAGRIQLAFMGDTRQPWQGTDQIERFATHRPEWQFHIIGDPSGLKTRPSNLRAHGFLPSGSFRSILENCDAAFGCLALYRTGLNENSALKVREYLAYGIPVILSGRDTDFEGTEPFLLSLPNRPNELLKNKELVSSFVHRWRGRRVDRTSINHLDVQIKEKKRLEFMSQVLRHQPRLQLAS